MATLISRTLFSQGDLICSAEAMDIEVHDFTSARLNGHRILTDLDLGTGINFGPVGNAPNANAATEVGNTVTLEPANGIFPGLLTAGTQTIGGNKTFTGTITAFNFSGTSTGSNSGDVTLTSVGAVPNANSASLVGQQLQLQPAATGFPGVVSTVAQSFDGNKTFNGTITASNFGGSTSGTNSGDVTLTSVGAVPNANAASLVGQQLQLQPASVGFPGLVTTGVQSFSGNKTFTGTISASNFGGNTSGSNTGDVTLTGVGASPNANAASLVGQQLQLQPASTGFPGLVTTAAQSFAGVKTFTADIESSNFFTATGIVTAGEACNKTATSTRFTCVGDSAGASVTTADFNSIYGAQAGALLLNGNSNCLFGDQCGNSMTSAFQNAIYGQNAGGNLTTGSQNSIFGTTANAGSSGVNNCIFGRNSGSAATTNTGCIYINNAGVAAETNATRIGTNQTTAFMPGFNQTPSATSNMVMWDPATFQITSQATNLTATLNSTLVQTGGGSITNMTIRGGAAQLNNNYAGITFNKIGKIVLMTLPQFSVATHTGTPTTVTVNDPIIASFRPANPVSTPLNGVSLGSQSNLIYVSVDSGTGIISLVFPVAQTGAYGFIADVPLMWITA